MMKLTTPTLAKMTLARPALAAICVSWSLCVTSLGASAQDYPNRVVTIVVPQSPAGVSDIAARLVGERLSNRWGKQVVIENKTGGGGAVGAGFAARAAGDGYTLLVSTNSEVALNPFMQKLSYEMKDLVPIAMLTLNPVVIAANVNSPFKTFADVITAAKAAPGTIGYSSPGVGTWNQLTAEWLSDTLGIKLLHVPYRGGGPAGTAVAAGDVPLGAIAISSAVPHVQSGRARVLLITTANRSKFGPDWPTAAETVAPGFDSQQWVGLFAPSTIDPKIRAKIEADVLAVLQEPEIRDRFEKAGAEVLAKGIAEAEKQLAADQKVAGDISKKIGLGTN